MTEREFRMTKQSGIRMTSPTNYKAKGIHPDGQIPLIGTTDSSVQVTALRKVCHFRIES